MQGYPYGLMRVLPIHRDSNGVDFLFYDGLSLGFCSEGGSERQKKDEISWCKNKLHRAMLLNEGRLAKTFRSSWNQEGLLIPTQREIDALPRMKAIEFLPYQDRGGFWETVFPSSEKPYNRCDENLQGRLIHIPHAYRWVEDDWDTLLCAIHDPIGCGLEEIGKGTEGRVFRFRYQQHDCALKIYDPEMQARLQQIRWVSFSKPMFLNNIGHGFHMERILRMMGRLPFEAVFPPTYAYGGEFTLSPYITHSLSVEDLIQRGGPSAVGEAFIRQHNIPEKTLQKIREALQLYGKATQLAQYADELRAFQIIDRPDPPKKRPKGAQRGVVVPRPPAISFRLVHDPHPKNILVKGVRGTQLQLAFIDQSVAPVGPSQDECSYTFYREQQDTARALFETVRDEPRLAQFFSTYFPNGFPA